MLPTAQRDYPVSFWQRVLTALQSLCCAEDPYEVLALLGQPEFNRPKRGGHANASTAERSLRHPADGLVRARLGLTSSATSAQRTQST